MPDHDAKSWRSLIRPHDFVWLLLFAGLIATAPSGDFSEVSMLVAFAAVQVLEPKIPALKTTGGRFLCLEFSSVDVPGLEALYDLYSFNVIPTLGRMVTGDAEAYRYLVESIRRFPAAEDFAAMIAEAGFERVSFSKLSGGIVAIHSGWKI